MSGASTEEELQLPVVVPNLRAPCLGMVEKLLHPVVEGLSEHKRQQLREHDALNGTIKEDEFCRLCGKQGHKQFIHVSSAVVNPPEWPGLDLSKQPPAVPLSQELDFSLTYKLKIYDNLVEDASFSFCKGKHSYAQVVPSVLAYPNFPL
ncbi:hypothetical protein KSP40_PGU000918 [Platanthera guangdongensis]|uniref:Uncharacterized protein n=1 Tax=Platanthera guangdongensis TaxID=2320717 RepID=A0ABR2MBI6_9ASPA